MAATFDLILLHGPQFSSRDIYHEKETASTHQKICPRKLYQQDADVGLRDVILKKKVVVDDDNAVRNTRESYVRMIQRKLSSKKIALVKVLPQFGSKQLYWSREFQLADHCSEDSEPLHDTEINKWFDGENLQDISYSSSQVSEPDEKEGFKVFERIMPLATFSSYKLEVPALFIQWEGMISTSDDNITLHENVDKVCEEWAAVNPCGRIFVLCDGSHTKQGTSSKAHEMDIKVVLSDLVNKFDSCPVYVLFISSLSDAGTYIQPPSPGMLAYLQKLHNLCLHCKSTKFLYHTPCHMRMAEEAGVQNIKITRVLQQPSLVKTSHVFNTPSIPSFLKQMEVIQSQEVTTEPRIPLYSEIGRLKDHHIVDKMSYGRQQYLFVRDCECLEKFNNEYVELATRVDTPSSKILSTCKCKTTDMPADRGSPPSSRDRLSCSLSSERGLPKWMLSNKKRNADLEKEESIKPSPTRSNSSGSNDGRIRQTVYVMTERELTEVATDILKQAGREDIIKRISLETIKKKAAAKKSPEKSNVDKDLQSASPVKDVAEERASVSEGDDEISVEEEEDAKRVSTTTKITHPCDSMSVTKDTVMVTKETNAVVRDTVMVIEETGVLDDFLPDQSVRKNSPQKRFRNKNPYSDVNDEKDRPSQNTSRAAVTSILDETFQTDTISKNVNKVDILDNRNTDSNRSPKDARDYLPNKKLKTENVKCRASPTKRLQSQEEFRGGRADDGDMQQHKPSVSTERNVEKTRTDLSILDEIFS